MRKTSKIKWLNLLFFLIATIGLIAFAQMFVRPNMVGWTIERVNIYDAANDIAIEFDYAFSDEYAYGIVMEQHDCSLEEDCDISLLVSKGRDVSLLPEEDIMAYLQELVEQGIITADQFAHEEREFSDYHELGYAIVYDPRPSEGRIDLVFSRGPQIFIERASFLLAGDLRVDQHNWDLGALLEPFQDVIQEADVAFVSDTANLGGFMLAPEEWEGYDDVNGYEEDLEDEAVDDEVEEEPPFENVLPQMVAAAGFDLVARAGREVFQTGLDGLLQAEPNWEGLLTAGINLEAADREVIPLFEVDALSVALLAYTTALNAHLPWEQPYLVNVFTYELAQHQIQLAIEAGADIIMVFMDWDTDDEALNESRAQWLANQGVQIVVGNQSQVQPITLLNNANRSETLVVHSLGQLVGEADALGLLLAFNVRQETMRGVATIHFENLRLMPTLNVFDEDDEIFVVLPLAENPTDDLNFESFKAEWEASDAIGLAVENLD